jgi:hypothetical protein
MRVESFILKGSRPYVARHTLSQTLQMGVMTALAVRYSFRALSQRLFNEACSMPKEFMLQCLPRNMLNWIQRSKAQTLPDVLGLDTNPLAGEAQRCLYPTSQISSGIKYNAVEMTLSLFLSPALCLSSPNLLSSPKNLSSSKPATNRLSVIEKFDAALQHLRTAHPRGL